MGYVKDHTLEHLSLSWTALCTYETLSIRRRSIHKSNNEPDSVVFQCANNSHVFKNSYVI